MKKLVVSSMSVVAVLGAIAALLVLPKDDPKQEISLRASLTHRQVRIAHTGSPHLAPLYVALGHGLLEDAGLQISLKHFGSSTDAGFALLAGRVDAVFLEPSKAFRLINENDDLGIKIVGSVNYNFGATLLVREDLPVRLNDLEGLTIAAGSRNCLLLNQFKHDAQRHGVDTQKINFVYLDFATMLPALEAGKIDGMITRASYTLPGQRQGHAVLYQNWDVSPGDACCPATLAHVEYFLLVKGIDNRSVGLLDRALAEASGLPAQISRDAIADFTQYPRDLLDNKPPVAYYQRLTPELKLELGDWVWIES